jgi:hypothetical protein
MTEDKLGQDPFLPRSSSVDYTDAGLQQVIVEIPPKTHKK